jgi:hypothetical protein
MKYLLIKKCKLEIYKIIKVNNINVFDYLIITKQIKF